MQATMWRFLLIVTVILQASFLHAQDDDACAPTENKKVLKLMGEASKGGKLTAKERHQKLKEALEEEECAECLFAAGKSAFSLAKNNGISYKAAKGYLTMLNEKCPEYHADMFYYLGVIEYGDSKFAEAYQWFRKFEDFPRGNEDKVSKDDAKKLADVAEIMPELDFYAEFYKNDMPFDPQVVPNISTTADEYLPMLSPDNEIMFFTRKRLHKAKGDIVGKHIEELTEARRKDIADDFNIGDALKEPFNVGDNYGGVTLSLNNKEMFVTICKPVTPEYKNCDIYRARYEVRIKADFSGQDYLWAGIQEIGEEINTEGGWEAQPTLSSDGRTMYFATLRPPPATDGTDIFYSERNDQGVWSPARPVPGKINTDGDEKAPFMHSDSRTLYFVSNGHRGAGGYDIFFSRHNADGTWTEPKNIGHPINTDKDELGLIVAADGKTAYIASDRFNGVGGVDVFTFELPKDARPDKVLIVKGQVRDENGEVVKDAEVEIKYMDTRKTEIIKVDEEDGRYATVVRLKEGDDVIMTVKKKDHVFDSRAFTAEDTVRAGVAKVDMSLQKIEVGKSYRINDIKYATSSADITKASKYILEEMIIFLKENPSVKIAVHGHTDNVGNEADNMKLSNDRASTVKDYIKEHGIAASRLSFKGFGPSKPLASNSNAEGRAQNRRTEFVIVSR